MKTITSTIGAVVFAMGLTLSAAEAQQASSPDVGFDIPTPEQAELARENRRSQALGERVARRVMTIFELYEAGDMDGAMAEIEDIPMRSATAYDRAYVARLKGTLLAGQDDDPTAIGRAIRELEAAAEPDVLGYSDQRNALQLLANLYLMEERYEEAIVAFRRYLQFIGEWNADTLIRMASASMSLQKYDQVIPFAEKALLHLEEPNRNPYVLMIAAYYETNQVQEAISVLVRGLQVLPEEKGWWVQLGMFYMLSEEFDKALATMRIAYDAGYFSRENDYRALYQLFANGGIPYQGAELMRRHLENGNVSKTAQNYSMAARTYYAAREFVRSAEMYRLAIGVADDESDIRDYYRRIGDALLLAERYRDAAPAFQAAIDRVPQGEDAGRLYMSLAEAYFYSNQYRQAYQAAQSATRFSSTRRNASSWAEYIRSTAERRGSSI
ncbi:MAG: hypothetical protein M1363_04175 [Gammaproteobacteria bacterium]|nr:hypothetical protein [Gammaproteobacteria bacterium]